MNYLDIENKKRKNKKTLEIVSKISTAIIVVMFFSKSLIAGLLALIGSSILYSSIIYSIKVQDEKSEELYDRFDWEPENLIFSLKYSLRNETSLSLYFILQCAIIYVVIMSISDLFSGIILYCGFIILGIGWLLILKVLYITYKYNFLVFEEGIMIGKIRHPYENMKRRQFIKLRRGGYLFEVNTGKAYFRIKLSDEQKSVVEELIERYSYSS